MEAAFLTQAGMLRRTQIFLILSFVFPVHRFDINLFRVRQAEGQLISVDPELHGVSHGSQFDNGNFRSGNDAHIQEMLPEGAFAADGPDDSGLAGMQRVEFHNRFIPSFRIIHSTEAVYYYLP